MEPNKTLLSTANSFLSSRSISVVCECLSGIGASREFELAARELDVLPRNSAMIDTCQKVLELEAKTGRSALDSNSAKVFHVYRFLCEFENGGLSGFLYNISPAWNDLSDLSTIAADLNRPEIAEAVGQVEAIVRRGPEDHQGTWGDWLDRADLDGELTELDQTISEHYDPLWEDLESIAVDE